MSSFISDEQGVMEPYTDLPAMALAVVGFIIFVGLVSQAYTIYQQKAFLAGHYQDAASLAEMLSKDSTLTSSTRPDIIDAAKIEKAKGEPDELMEKYGAHYNLMFRVEVYSAGRTFNWVIRDPEAGNPAGGISSSVPVTVKINEVQELPGILSVRIWEKEKNE